MRKPSFIYVNNTQSWLNDVETTMLLLEFSDAPYFAENLNTTASCLELKYLLHRFHDFLRQRIHIIVVRIKQNISEVKRASETGKFHTFLRFDDGDLKVYIWAPIFGMCVL